MSTNSIGKIKKNKNHTNNNSKRNNKQLFSLHNNSLPKKLDYSKIAENNLNTYLTETVVRNTNGCFGTERHCSYEEKIRRNPYENKFNSPKESTNRITSSNLPTANNSFHTTISSPEYDKNFNMEEYEGLTANLIVRSGIQSRKNTKRKTSEDLESVDGEMSPNSSVHLNPKAKISEDFKTKFKTEICKFWEVEKLCKYGDNCAFAHGQTDLRKKSNVTNSYRTKPCKQFFENGICPYGNRCQFAHSSNITKNNQSEFSYKKYISMLCNLKEIEKKKIKLNRPRLTIFQGISKSREVPKYSLIDDILVVNEEMNNKKCKSLISDYGQNCNNQIKDFDCLNDHSYNEYTNRSRLFSH